MLLLPFSALLLSLHQRQGLHLMLLSVLSKDLKKQLPTLHGHLKNQSESDEISRRHYLLALEVSEARLHTSNMGYCRYCKVSLKAKTVIR